MAKRGRSGNDVLTGGTADVSPQLLTTNLAQTAPNTFIEQVIPVPIARYASDKTTAVVIELLKVYYNLGEADTNPAAAGGLITIMAQLATSTKNAILFGNPTVLSFAEKVIRGAFTAAGSYAAIIHEPFVQDLTDGAGHGVLVASDSLFFGINTIGFVGVSSVNVKILYRFKRIGLAEYIGIAQSQA